MRQAIVGKSPGVYSQLLTRFVRSSRHLSALHFLISSGHTQLVQIALIGALVLTVFWWFVWRSFSTLMVKWQVPQSFKYSQIPHFPKDRAKDKSKTFWIFLRVTINNIDSLCSFSPAEDFSCTLGLNCYSTVLVLNISLSLLINNLQTGYASLQPKILPSKFWKCIFAWLNSSGCLLQKSSIPKIKKSIICIIHLSKS